MGTKHRSRELADRVVGFSAGYERENLLRRGMGYEHLRELLVRVARPLLRQGANIAYGGSWEDRDDNLLFELLRLVRAEQEDKLPGSEGSDDGPKIGKLYNHSAWPNYLKITPSDEAGWIAVCRIVRIDQAQAGLDAANVVADSDAGTPSARVRFNKAVALSAMRRAMMVPGSITIPDAPPERVPPIAARVLLGGRMASYTGFIPGIFEEALVSLQHKCPTYILGGFGGASEVLARAMLSQGGERPAELTLEWHRANNSMLDALLNESTGFLRPAQIGAPGWDLDALYALALQARGGLSTALKTGLTDEETRELMQTCNVGTAVRLLSQGLHQCFKLSKLPA